MRCIWALNGLFVLLISCSKPQPLPVTLNTYQVQLNVDGNGTLSQSSGTFDAGTSMVITATPAEGFYFSGWIGDLETDENPLTFVVSEAVTLTAVFLPVVVLSDEIVVYESDKMDRNNVFVIENGGLTAYLIDKTGARLQTWNFDLNLGNDLEYSPDGSVIGMFKPRTTQIGFGGYGGILRKYDPSGTLTWEYEVNTEDEILHHDFVVLPNNNIVTMIWERISAAEASAAGFPRTTDIFLEKIIEINPETNEVVWQWRSWDHTVQDINDQLPNYGDVTTNFNKIDVNYNDNENGDLMHANGLEYDAEKDLIYMSVNFYSEVWVIDHATTTETAIGPAGDLKYRFGNPSAYKSDATRLFNRNHHPNFVTLDPETEGHMIVYMNGNDQEQSVVFDLIIPDTFTDPTAGLIAPEVHWTYTHPDLYNGKISGAVRLANGNTLICEGDYGYWEVTPEGEIVWKYFGGGINFWRGYSIPVN